MGISSVVSYRYRKPQRPPLPRHNYTSPKALCYSSILCRRQGIEVPEHDLIHDHVPCLRCLRPYPHRRPRRKVSATGKRLWGYLAPVGGTVMVTVMATGRHGVPVGNTENDISLEQERRGDLRLCL